MNRLSYLLALLLALALVGCPTGRGGGGGDDDDDSAATDDDDGADDDDAASDEYGPENSWWHAQADDVPGDLAGTGWNTGAVAHDFTLEDQFGDQVQLYQFYGKIVVLDVFAQWCGPCQANAPHGQTLWLDGGGEVIVIGIMQEDTGGGAPDNADINAWADAYSLEHPVLADPGATQSNHLSGGYPTYVVLDREMVIIQEDLWPFDPAWVLAQL